MRPVDGAAPARLAPSTFCRWAVVAAAVASTLATGRARADAPLFADPEMPPPRRIVEQGESPRELRLPRDGLDAGLRANVGPAVRLGIGRETGKTAFALDLLVGATLPLQRGGRWAVLGEAGYSFVGFSEHLATFGVGPMIRGLGPSPPSYVEPRESGTDERPPGLRGIFAFALVPRLVGGIADGERTVGARTSLVAGLWLWSLELSHQYLSTDRRDIHQIAFAFSFWPYAGSLR